MDKPAKCDFCGEPAVTFMQNIVDGESKTVAICSKCMKSMGIDISIPETVLRAFDFTPGVNDEHLAEQCSCGMTGEAAADGLAGCEECYSRFRSLWKAIREVDPEDAPPKEPETERECLQAEMQAAVDDEDYELAAVIRDKIKMLEDAGNADEK